MYDTLLATPGIQYRIASRSVERINEVGINPATQEAYEEAIRGLLAHGLPVSEVRVDGNPAWPPTLFQEAPTRFIQHGDALDWVIGAASIIAKVTRDSYMRKLANQYPEFGFERNFGYGTKEHLAAIKSLGLTPLHRTRFCRKVALPEDAGPGLIEELFG